MWLHDSSHDDTDELMEGPPPPPVDRIVLIIDAIGSPKVQLFVQMVLRGKTSPTYMLPPVPFVVDALVGTSRMGGKNRTVQTLTSDELSRALTMVPGSKWEVRPLTWASLLEPNLLLHKVVATQDAWMPTRKIKVAVADGFDILNLGNPFEHGF